MKYLPGDKIAGLGYHDAAVIVCFRKEMIMYVQREFDFIEEFFSPLAVKIGLCRDAKG